jgi:hypothetical protein
VYLCAFDITCPAGLADVIDGTEVADGVREKGDGIAVERRNGLAEDEETGGEAAGTLV